MKIERAIQEGLRMLKFDDVNSRYQGGKLGCEGAAELLGVDVRTFLRWRNKHEETGGSDWQDGRVGKPSSRKAADTEVEKVTRLYRDKYRGFNVAHFHAYLCWEEGFSMSYSWVKRTLGAAGLVVPSKQGGDHRLRRPRRPQTGMMIHQDGSTHNWFGESMCDLIVTMDDANSEITSAFFCPQEGTLSSLRGIAETIEKHGLFCSFYTDRGSHYWFTPEAGGKVDKTRLTEVGRALKQLGINHIPAYSPEARGRSERMFGTLQGRLPAEFALHKITTMEAANAYLRDVYLKRHNKQFTVAPTDNETAFIPYVGLPLVDILCLQEERVVAKDNTVSYQGKILQIPASAHRHHFVKATVTVCQYQDNSLAIFHGHQCLARFDKNGLSIAIVPLKAVPLKTISAPKTGLPNTTKKERKRAVCHGDKCSGSPSLHTYPHDKQPPPQQAVSL